MIKAGHFTCVHQRRSEFIRKQNNPVGKIQRECVDVQGETCMCEMALSLSLSEQDHVCLIIDD